MTEEQKTYSEQYRRVREAFDELQLESQARFLIEATAATIGRGIDALAQAVAEDIDEAFRAHEEQESETSPGAEAEEAQPENGLDGDGETS